MAADLRLGVLGLARQAEFVAHGYFPRAPSIEIVPIFGV